MADADRVAAALRYQEEQDALRPATMNPMLARQGERMRAARAAQAMRDTSPAWYEQAIPMEGRAAFLPYQDTLPGSVMNERKVALPGILAGALNAFSAPGRALSGSDPNFNPEEEAFNTALNVMGGGFGGTAPSGALMEGMARARNESTARSFKRGGGTITVTSPQRVAYPGVYKPADQIATEAKTRMVPESENLKRLFGVTREELASIADRKGNMQDPMREMIPNLARNVKGSDAASKVTTDRNANRILEALRASEIISPELITGMKGWYVQDPMYQRILEMTNGNKEEALRRYNQINAFSGIESPQLKVEDEIRRAAAGNYMAEQGRHGEWGQYGSVPATSERNALMPGLETVIGRMGGPRIKMNQESYLATGQTGMASPKAPLYIAASGVPEGRFQTSVPVADAHFSRAIGLPDVRTAKGIEVSASTPELSSITPWWRQLSAEAGMESVPTQAVTWGLFSPQTGVTSRIGAPKLELTADLIAKRAKQLGRNDLENVRDEYLMGRGHLGANASGVGLRLGEFNSTQERQ